MLMNAFFPSSILRLKRLQIYIQWILSTELFEMIKMDVGVLRKKKHNHQIHCYIEKSVL